MTGETIHLLASICAIVAAACFGPTIIVIRAALRLFLAPQGIRRWQHAANLGTCAGLIGATALTGWLFGATAASQIAVMILLALLAAMDLAWRWLPTAWTAPLIGLGLLAAALSGDWQTAIAGLLAGAGLLFGLQLWFRLRHGLDALGTGDIWLAAGLGSLTGATQIMLLLGLAALTGLAVTALSKALGPPARKRRFGVAYGAHMCVAYILFVPF